MISYRIISLILAFLTAVVIVMLIRRGHLRIIYSVWWFLIALSILFLGAFPNVVDYVCAKMGIHYPPILVVVIGIIFILIKQVLTDIEISKQEKKIRILTERLALFEHKKL
ncbi:DUF2304 domain-containing protein [Candidatus Magnetomoraceae bacterium gMMP-15]